MWICELSQQVLRRPTAGMIADLPVFHFPVDNEELGALISSLMANADTDDT